MTDSEVQKALLWSDMNPKIHPQKVRAKNNISSGLPLQKPDSKQLTIIGRGWAKYCDLSVASRSVISA